MFGLIKRIARQNLYSSGPKSGEVSKVYPDAKTLQGIQPGTGQRLSAEEFNYFLSAATRTAALAWFDAFTPQGAGVASSELNSFAWAPNTGRTYGSSVAHDRVILYGYQDPAEASAAGTYFGVGTPVQGRAATQQKNADGELRALVFGQSQTATTTIRALDPDGISLDTGELSLAPDVVSYVAACYDNVNGAAICLVANASRALKRIVRVVDGATTVTLATTLPTLPTDFYNDFAKPDLKGALVSGGGVTMMLVQSPSGSRPIYCAKSLDGGDNWSDVTPPTTTTDDKASKPFFSADFLAGGPAFGFFMLDDVAETAAVYYTRDEGATWLSVAVPYITNFDALGARVVGDSLIRRTDSSVVIDCLGSGSRFYTNFAGSYLYSDGFRIFSQNTSSFQLSVSGWLLPSLDIDGSSQDI